MRHFLTFGLFLCFAFVTHSQYWDSIGRFSSPPTKYYYDTLDDRLYVAGGYYWYDSSEIHGFGYYESDTLYGLGCGFERPGLPPCQYGRPWSGSLAVVHDMVRFKGVLYATGSFTYAGGQMVNGIAKWGATDWEPLGRGLTLWGPNGTSLGDGIGYGFEIYQDTLYLFGAFDTINDKEAFGVAKFDGSTWFPVGLPRFDTAVFTNPNLIMAAKWYQGELYIGGGFYWTGISPPIYGLAKWNGSAVVNVDKGITSSGAGGDDIYDIDIFQGELIVAGRFDDVKDPGSIPGIRITAWNGSSWNNMRGGLGTPLTSATVYDVFVTNDALYAVGKFNSAGGLPCINVAKWDGAKWCVPDSAGMDMDNGFIYDVARFEDSLYIGGPYYHMDNNAAYRYAARLVGDIEFLCQPPLSSEKGKTVPDVTVFPNPVSGKLYIRSEAGIIYEANIYDIQGRKTGTGTGTGTGNAREVEINFENIPPGMYVVEVRTGDGITRRKVVRE